MKFYRDSELATNRGNHLLIYLLKTRFPNIFKTEQINRVTKMLSQPLDKGMINHHIPHKNFMNNRFGLRFIFSENFIIQ